MTVETPQIYGVKDALDYGQDHVSCFRVWESLAERLGHSVRRRNVPLVCSASMHDVYLTDGVCMNHQLLFDINDMITCLCLLLGIHVLVGPSTSAELLT